MIPENWDKMAANLQMKDSYPYHCVKMVYIMIPIDNYSGRTFCEYQWYVIDISQIEFILDMDSF